MSLTPIEEEEIRCLISDHLVEIERLFKLGAKVSCIVTNSIKPDGSGNVFVGNDSIENAILGMQLLLKDGHTSGAPLESSASSQSGETT